MSEDLSYPGGKLRLYVEAALGPGARVEPDVAQTHYLLHVMRAKAGDRVNLFNGRDGEWVASLADIAKRSCTLVCDARIGEQGAVPDLWFVFAPVKKTPADYVVQKATELGARRLIVTGLDLVRRLGALAAAASPPAQARRTGLRRSGTISPARAPTPQSANTETSNHPSASMAHLPAAAPGATRRASERRQHGEHNQ